MQTIRDLQRKIDCDITHLVKSIRDDFNNGNRIVEEMIVDRKGSLKDITPIGFLRFYLNKKFDLRDKLEEPVFKEEYKADFLPTMFDAEDKAEVEVTKEPSFKTGEEIAKETNESNKSTQDLNNTEAIDTQINNNKEVNTMQEEDKPQEEAPDEDKDKPEAEAETTEESKDPAAEEEEKEE